MGREATCHCKWGSEEGDCKVLLEGRELILRSGIRRRVALSAVSSVAARGANLVFTVGQEKVALCLGVVAAPHWAKAIQAPPLSLAGKLGISRATRLSVVGNIESDELNEAPSPAYVSDFLATSDGLALTKAFMRIPDMKLRRRIVDLVEQIAVDDDV